MSNDGVAWNEPEVEFSIPPVQIEDVVSSLRDARNSEHIGWQIRAWQAQKIHDEFGVTGHGIRVGVGDTGVSRQHLSGDLDNVVEQETFVGDRNPYDRNGHGSHCLGIIGAGNNDGGILGYAPNCEMLSAKVLSDRGSGGDKGISDGIRWMVEDGASIISLSLGSPSPSQRILNAIAYAHENEVIVFAAAGNDGRSNNIDEPANSGQCIPVGAINSSLRLANFSDRGRSLQSKGFVAGGVNVYSTVSKGYASYSGTSMATPGAAGQCALLQSAEKKFLGEIKTNTMFKFLDVVDRFQVDLGPTGNDTSYGRGAFNIYGAVKALAESERPKPEPEPNPPSPGGDGWETVYQNEAKDLRVQER